MKTIGEINIRFDAQRFVSILYPSVLETVREKFTSISVHEESLWNCKLSSCCGIYPHSILATQENRCAWEAADADEAELAVVSFSSVLPLLYFSPRFPNSHPSAFTTDFILTPPPF